MSRYQRAQQSEKMFPRDAHLEGGAVVVEAAVGGELVLELGEKPGGAGPSLVPRALVGREGGVCV